MNLETQQELEQEQHEPDESEAAFPPRLSATAGSTWTFLTNHSHVLLCLAHDPSARLRDVADAVGITERAVQRLVADLEEAGVLSRVREGRRNRYVLHEEIPLRHPIEHHCHVSDLLDMVLPERSSRK